MLNERSKCELWLPFLSKSVYDEAKGQVNAQIHIVISNQVKNIYLQSYNPLLSKIILIYLKRLFIKNFS